MSQRRHKIAFVGCGDLFEKSFLPRLLQVDGLRRFEVVALCDVDASRAARFQSDLGCRRFSEYDRMLAEARPEVVAILTPARGHVSQALAAMQSGADVYLQKPAATSVSELDRLISAAAATGRLVVCALAMQRYPTIAAIADTLRSGAIGPVFYAVAPCMGWGGQSLDGTPANPSWHFEAGSGPLRDHGVYTLVTLTALFGPALRVCAMNTITVPQRGWRGTTFPVTEPDNVAVILEHAHGVLVHLHEAWSAESEASASLRIVGLEGSLHTFGGIWDVNPHGFDHYGAHGVLVDRVDLRDRFEARPFGDPFYNPHAWVDLLHLVDCIDSGSYPSASPAAMRPVYLAIDAIDKAAATGTTVAV